MSKQLSLDLDDDKDKVRIVFTKPTAHVDYNKEEFDRLQFDPVACKVTGAILGLTLLTAGVYRKIVDIFGVDNKGKRIDD